MQEFTIDTSTKDYTVNHTPKTGITKALYYYEPTGKLVNSETGQASTSGLTYTKRVENDVLYIDCKCAAGNPLILGAPKINYEFTLKVTRPGSVRITGKHDGFPAYEFWRKLDGKTAKQVWLHDPRVTGDTVLSLGMPMEYTNVDTDLSYDS